MLSNGLNSTITYDKLDIPNWTQIPRKKRFVEHEEIQSIKKNSFYRNMQRPSSKAIPDMRGKWTTTATIFTRRSPDEPPNFDNIQTVSFPTEIEQKDHFLIIKEIGVTQNGSIKLSKSDVDTYRVR